MIVAIGDVHAYYDKMMDLLDKLLRRGINFNETQFVFLGDYVDGGDQAKATIDAIMDFKEAYPHWQFLMGNHEDLMIACTGWAESICAESGPNDYTGAYYLWFNQGGKETLRSYIAAMPFEGMDDYQRALVGAKDAIPDEHFQWLRDLPLTYETEQYIFVHAGLNPQGESTNFHKLWIRDFFIYSDVDFGKRVVFGHTYQRSGPLLLPNKIGIDTMHHGGGALTAAILHDDGSVEFEQSFST